jgi:hypothetical protein
VYGSATLLEDRDPSLNGLHIESRLGIFVCMLDLGNIRLHLGGVIQVQDKCDQTRFRPGLPASSWPDMAWTQKACHDSPDIGNIRWPEECESLPPCTVCSARACNDNCPIIALADRPGLVDQGSLSRLISIFLCSDKERLAEPYISCP